MAITLNPVPTTLGILAPVLGPWFSTPVTLPAPDLSRKLALRFDPSGANWLPPATGTLSLFVADTANPPGPIAQLTDANSNWPFTTGQLVACYRLLPEVEARLHDLMRFVPPATSATLSSVPTAPAPVASRPRVRWLVVVPPVSAVTHDSVVALFGGAGSVPGSTDAERMTALGLALDGATVRNGAIPMTWLRRPGHFLLPDGITDQQDVVLTGLAGATDLWAFDARGRAIDPGAVAAWWSWLMTDAVGGSPPQLLARGIDPITLQTVGTRRAVCGFSAARTAHLVDAHEGPLAAPLLGERLLAGGTAASTNLQAVTGSLALTFAPVPAPTPPPPPDNPAVDNAPRPRLAALPDGAYQRAVTLWPSGAVIAGLERDFARVAAVDEEFHLLGVRRRDSRQAATTEADRMASSQNRPSTRTTVARTASTNPVLLATADDAAAALLAVWNPTAPTRATLGVADAQWGAATALAEVASPPAFPTALVDGDPTATAGTYRVRALSGGGASAGDHQAVLVEVNLGAGHQGTWFRAWPLGFDLRTGLHFRMTGGGGRADAAGQVRLVMTLAAGRVDSQGLLSMDTQVSRIGPSGLEQRSYADRRFARPAPVGGAPASASFAAGTAWAICETGQTGTGALPAASVLSGATVVVTGATPAVVDRRTLPASALVAGVLRNRLHAGDIVSLTQPACQSTPDRADALGRPLPRSSTDGNPVGGLDAVTGVIVHRLDRGLVASVSAASAPFALQDRLEVAAVSVQTGAAPSASAALGGAPPLSYAHELPPHFLGHPGAPGALEIHGTGVALDGAPAIAVAEYVRERTAGLGFAFVQTAAEPVRSIAVQSELAVAAEAVTALPDLADGAGAGPVVAVLRTGPLGQEGIPGLALAAKTTVYPLSQSATSVVDWLNGLNLPSSANNLGTQLRGAVAAQTDSITRALDRRLQVGAFGAREAAVALAAAFARAQDLVYIETPALDNLSYGSDPDQVNLWSQLIARVGQRKGLQVVVCVPTLLAPGTPRMLQGVRDAALLGALDAMRAAAPDRFAAFSPGAGAGRALRLATTTVVVDDAFALTGTTHLWRRGLTYDSSLAAAVFDERVVDGRPQEVRNFRIRLLADRLGLPVTRVPDDAAELVRAIRQFDERGSVRLSATAIQRPDPLPTDEDQNTWNPDGARSDLTLAAIAALFAAAVALTDVDHAIIEA